MLRQECIERQVPPDVSPGDTSAHGVFLRNLKKKHIAKRFENDTDENPAYGYKLKTKFWNDAARQGAGFSVNLKPCIHSDTCSIELQANSREFYHVAEIDLEKLNLVLAPNVFVAQYSPEEDNQCHFVLLPLDGTATALLNLRTALDRNSQPNLPASDEEREVADRDRASFEQVIQIRRWVRNRLGNL